jgi:hypothetical protein
MLALEEKIWSMMIAERGADDQPIRFGICIQGGGAEIYARRDETEGCRLRQEETVENNFHCKQEDVVAVASMSYIGHRMTKTNYSVYSHC